MMNYYYGSGMGGWAMALMIVSNLAFWGLVIVGAVALIRYTRRGQVGASSNDTVTPQQLLGQRFARGDIDEDEYTKRLQLLSSAATRPATPRR